MDDPTFDADGYPTDETLAQIKTWEVHGFADFETIMDFAGRAWHYDAWEKTRGYIDPDGGVTPCLRYVFSTYGWSGNESIVGAIEDNLMLQAIGAWSWRRGGHYEYRFPMEVKSDEKS